MRASGAFAAAASAVPGVDVPSFSWPSVLPIGWRRVPSELVVEGVPAHRWTRSDGLAVIGSVEPHARGGRWIHVSLSRASRLPSWVEVRAVKDLFVGRDRLAVQVLPPEKLYVNVHRYCLHLWSCLDDPQLVPNDALFEHEEA